MGGMLPKFIHTHRLQRVVHAPADLGGGDAEVFGGESHVLLHHVGDDLVIRVLKDHAHRAADIQQQIVVGGIHAADKYLAAGRQQNGVHMLGQCGLAGAVMPQHGDKGPLLDLQIHAVQHHGRDAFGSGVGEAEVLCLNDTAHKKTPLMEWGPAGYAA